VSGHRTRVDARDQEDAVRFSTFHQPLAPTSDDDARVIDELIEQVVAAEELGFETAWLTEHLFNATCAYGDPTLIAAALSQRTTRIRVGFAVLQMAMTHPARLVIQAGLLDNLLRGRLTLGLGRGSAFNPHEYEAFGVSPDAEHDRAQMFEAIELMERAWAGDGSFDGEHYHVEIPEVRPAPVQRPHPPIVLAVLSDETLRWSAQHGHSVLMPRLQVGRAMNRLAFFREALEEAGHDAETVERLVDGCAMTRTIYVAESEEAAHAELQAAEVRHRGGRAPDVDSAPGMVPDPRLWQATPGAKTADTKKDAATQLTKTILGSTIGGTPEAVRVEIAKLNDAGVPELMLAFSRGDIPHKKVLRSMELFATEVMPAFASEPASI
jgi:alkanesulfonate monooxygenase SsuD/methylene tetrahydromethanopterin reductase-like flavin-dependent oxidoreductase (luciferase family)